MRHLKLAILLATMPMLVNAQPSAVVRDEFGDEAAAWLKKHPDVEKCADQKSDAHQKQQKKDGIDPITTSDVYGEFIQACNKKMSTKEKSAKK